MSNPLGVTYSMRQEPHLPLLSVGCIAYPSGGIQSTGLKGCALGVRVQRERIVRNRGRDVTIKEYLSVAVWAEEGAVPLLAQSLAGRTWDAIFFNRRPTVFYEQLLETLPRSVWREFPEDWTDDTCVSIANDLLRRLPISADASFIGACEAKANVRRAFAGALAGVRYLVGEARAAQAGPIQTKRGYTTRIANLLGQSPPSDSSWPSDPPTGVSSDAVPYGDF